MKRILNKIQTGIILLLAAGTPVVAVLDEKYWFEKRIGLAAAAMVLLALWASQKWKEGKLGRWGMGDMGWGLLAAGMAVAAVVPAGRIANLMAPDLWAALGAVVVVGISGMAGGGKEGKIRGIRGLVWAVTTGVVVAAGITVIGVSQGGEIWGIGGIGGIGEQGRATLGILQRSPIWGEFREFRVARLGILQTASGLGILGILGSLALVYQIGLTAVKGIIKDGSVWEKLLNGLVLLLLAGFLVLSHPALTLWPLAVTAGIAGGTSGTTGGGEKGGIRGIRGFVWAGSVGLLVVTILGLSFGLGRAIWGEMKFREALAAANRNEGITTYHALLESIKRNPYEVRYHLLASQIDLALANSIASQAGVQEVTEGQEEPERESTPSAQLTVQDQNNILVLIQQAVVEGKAAIKLDPENSALWQNLGSIYRSLIGVAGGAEDWALKCYQRAAELSPNDHNSHLGIGEIHFLGGNFQGAAEAFKEAVRIAPNSTQAHYNLAVAYNAAGELDRAIAELEETFALLPTDDPSREQVEKDIAFLKGEQGHPGEQEKMEIEAGGTEKTDELKEATTSAEVESPPPPVGPPEATESAETENEELRIKNEEGR